MYLRYALGSMLLFGGCANEPAQFSQAQPATKVKLTVESADSLEADTEANQVLPATSVTENDLNILFDAFQQSDGDISFDPDQYVGTQLEPDDQTNSADTETNPSSDTDSAASGDSNPNSTATDTAAADTGKPAGTDTTTKPQSSTPTETTTDVSLPPDLAMPNVSEMKLCAKMTGVDVSAVGVSHKDSIKSGSVIALKIAGNKANIELDLVGGSGATLKGLCVFVAGNASQITGTIGLKVDNFLYIGRGNSTSGTLTMPSGLGAGAVSLTGNDAKLTLTLSPKTLCEKIYIHGNKAAYICN